MGHTQPFQHDLDEFEDWLIGQRFAENTVSRRRILIATCLREWGTWDVRPAEVAAWLRQWQGWTARTYFSHLRSGFAWAVETGRIDVDPTARMKAPPQPQPAPRPLPTLVLREALETSSGRTNAYLLMAYLAGLRAHEIAKFRGEDITEARLRVVGKGGRDAIVPTHPALWALAQDHPRRGLWFPSLSGGHVRGQSVSDTVRSHLRRLGVESGSIHRVRASYGTDLLRGGTNVRVVQKLMRHGSLAATEHYLEATEDEQRTGILGLVA